MRARLIYNPKSGKEIMRKYLPDVLFELEIMGYETSTFQTTSEPHSAKNEAKRAALAGFNLIVAAGGDGTINEIINGIAPLANRPMVAIIPAGTTNDYARALKIPRTTPVEAIRVLKKNQTIEMDVGLAGEKYFINIAAGGGLTELTFEVPSELKTMFGYLAYLAKGAEMLPRVKPLNVRITHDEGVYEGNTSMFFAGLTNSVGGFESYAPDAKLDDGFFSLIIIKSSNVIELMRLVALLLNNGEHIKDSKVVYVKTKTIKVEILDRGERMMLNLDGEYGGDAPVEMVNLQKHIKFFANLDEISSEAMLGYDEEGFVNTAEKYVNGMDEIKG
ncbi:MAG: diacylglycerol kinase [Streptococcaceae bacterium]|jgi:diacylglycerol kinase (ATP)|nr:diacylglycerol kinase [Streptococcaceae bacterium]